MRTLSAEQRRLISNRALAWAPIIEVKVLVDHLVPTFAPSVFVSTLPLFEFSAVGKSELSFLERITLPVETMSHLPAASGSGSSTAIRRSINFSLVNALYEGLPFYEHLTAQGRLDQAEVVLSIGLFPPGEICCDLRHQDFIDGNTSQGELIEWFAGSIDRVVSVGADIQCVATTDQPLVPWKYVPDNGSDPRDRGLRFPRPMGLGALVRCVNLVVGSISSLEARAQIGDNSLTLADASDFGTTGNAMLGAELVSWSGKTDNTLTSVLRAQGGTTEADWVVGSTIIETTDPLILGVADTPIATVRDLFVISLTTGATVHLNDLLYAVDYNDETNAPGSAGDPITTITLEANQTSIILNSLTADAAVILQAEYESDISPGTVLLDSQGFTKASGTTLAGTSGALGDWTDVTGAGPPFPNWAINKSAGDQDQFRGTVTNAPSPSPTSDDFRLVSQQFSVTLDVLTYSSTAAMSIGLAYGGATSGTVFDVLQGVQEGSLVAFGQINGTGTVTLTGDVFLTNGFHTIGDIADTFLFLVLGEPPTSGNPSVTFEILDIVSDIEYINDLVETAPQLRTMDDGAVRVEFGTGKGPWTDDQLPTPIKQYNFAGDQLVYRVRFTANPFQGTEFQDSQIVKLEGRLQTIMRDQEASQNDTTSLMHFDGPWDGLLTSTPSDIVNTHTDAQNGVTIDSGTINLGTMLSGITPEDFNDVAIQIFLEAFGTGGVTIDDENYEFIEFSLAFTFLERAPNENIPRLVDTQIQAAAGGVGLEFYALCDGPEVPVADTSYSVAAGELIEHPSDIIRFWLQEVGGFAAADVDDVTFDAAVTNLPSYVFGFDARNLGTNWEEILFRLGYESRANIVRPSGGDWQMLTANTSHSWGAGSGLVDSIADLIAIGKDNDEIRTRLTVYYAFDPRNEAFDNRAFVKVLTTDPTDPAVVDREEEFGRDDAPEMFLLCHGLNADTQVADWLGYMEQELGRFARVVACRVDHWEGFELEIGDVTTLQHLALGAAAITVRVIETQWSRAGGFLIRFAEVV